MLIIKTRVPQVATREGINHEAWGAIGEGGGRQPDMTLEHTGVCLGKVKYPDRNGGTAEAGVVNVSHMVPDSMGACSQEQIPLM